MKGFVKCLIAGGVILCIGVIILLCGLAANGWKWQIDEDFEQKEYVAENEVTAYDIRIAAGTVKVEFTDDEVASVSYPESEHFRYTVTEENGKLTVAYDKQYNFFFGWLIPSNIPDTVIKVPKKVVADYDIKISAGKLILPQGDYGKLKVELNAGKFETGAIVCTDFDCDVSAGAAILSSVECPTLFVGVSAGGVTIDNAICNRLTVEVSAGSADLSGVKCDDISVDVSAGSVNLGVIGAKAEYNVSVDKSAGSCNLSSQVGSDPSKRIEVDISAGSVTVNFGYYL